MSTEYPPIIIDSSGLMETTNNLQSLGSVVIRYDTDATAAEEKLVAIEPSQVTLYLILENQLFHQGDYRSEEIQLIYGFTPEMAMTAGAETMTLVSDADSDSVPDGLGRRGAIEYRNRQVHTIRVPDRYEPLRYGQDYHNFVLIIRRKLM